MLKIEGEARDFQHSPRDLGNVDLYQVLKTKGGGVEPVYTIQRDHECQPCEGIMNDKIMLNC